MRANVVVMDVLDLKEKGIALLGAVTGGNISTGMKLNLNGQIMSVTKIEKKHKIVDFVSNGENASFFLQNSDYALIQKYRKTTVIFSNDGSFNNKTPKSINISKSPTKKVKLIASIIISLPISIVLALFGFSAFTVSRSQMWSHLEDLTVIDFFVGLVVWMIIFTSVFYFIASIKKSKK